MKKTVYNINMYYIKKRFDKIIKYDRIKIDNKERCYIWIL